MKHFIFLFLVMVSLTACQKDPSEEVNPKISAPSQDVQLKNTKWYNSLGYFDFKKDSCYEYRVSANITNHYWFKVTGNRLQMFHTVEESVAGYHVKNPPTIYNYTVKISGDTLYFDGFYRGKKTP